VTEETADGDVGQAAHEPRQCMPCGGEGKLISNLGGTPSKVTCPWCDGTGMRKPGIDAQTRWASAGEAPAGAEAPAGSAASGPAAAEPEVGPPAG
jgi:DnaJ-class molecular chaperone